MPAPQLVKLRLTASGRNLFRNLALVWHARRQPRAHRVSMNVQLVRQSTSVRTLVWPVSWRTMTLTALVAST